MRFMSDCRGCSWPRLPYGMPDVQGCLARSTGVMRLFQAKVSSSALEPHAGVQPVFAEDPASEPQSGLNHNPALLRVNCDRSAPLCQLHEPNECLAQLGWLANKVVRHLVAPARVPHISSDKLMASLRTAPERLFGPLTHELRLAARAHNVPPELQPPPQNSRTAHDSRGGC
jgi:hypothetical protein